MKKFFAAIFGLAFFYCSTCAAYTAEGHLRITMLNVGQGDSFLIETHEQNILIDTGGVDSSRLLAEIKKAGINRFERIILTHAHADHIGGVLAVLENYHVDEIIDNGIESASPLYRKYHEVETKFTVVKAGARLDFGDRASFKVLHPPAALVAGGNVNNESIVGRLSFGGFVMLFTGDIESAAEKSLLKKNLYAVVLKAPHHGSKTGSTKKFVEAVQPQFVLISAGEKNKFGHPHKKTIERYLASGVAPEDIFCTAFHGTVIIETDGFDTTVKAENYFFGSTIEEASSGSEEAFFISQDKVCSCCPIFLSESKTMIAQNFSSNLYRLRARRDKDFSAESRDYF